MNTEALQSMSTGMPHCAIYARTAQEPQLHNSIESQIRECKDAARHKGWMALDDYVLCDRGKSGITLQGLHGLHELIMLAQARPRPFDHLLCASIDRLSRDISLLEEVIETFMRSGVHVHFASDGPNEADSSIRLILALSAHSD